MLQCPGRIWHSSIAFLRKHPKSSAHLDAVAGGLLAAPSGLQRSAQGGALLARLTAIPVSHVQAPLQVLHLPIGVELLAQTSEFEAQVPVRLEAHM